MPKPTEQEIAAEIVKLKELKPYIPAQNFFNEDHHAALEAQIDVLENTYSEDALYDRYVDEGENVKDEALFAHEWKEGQNPNPPSASWAELDVRNSGKPTT